jgi:hypothetical protein
MYRNVLSRYHTAAVFCGRSLTDLLIQRNCWFALGIFPARESQLWRKCLPFRGIKQTKVASFRYAIYNPCHSTVKTLSRWCDTTPKITRQFYDDEEVEWKLGHGTDWLKKASGGGEGNTKRIELSRTLKYLPCALQISWFLPSFQTPTWGCRPL